MSNLILHGMTAAPQTLPPAAANDALIGVPANVVQHFWSMQSGFKADGTIQYSGFPLANADGLWKNRQLYLHTWATYDWKNGVAWTPVDILAGKHDAYLHAQAITIKTWGHPLFIRLNHEFNLRDNPWNWDPAAFVNVWHYIVQIFRLEQASNVTWVWCPNQLASVGNPAPSAADKIFAYLPDPADFHWTGFDAYNWAASRNIPWQSWAQIGDLSYNTIAKLAPNKPMMIAEFGCHNVGGDRNAWLRDTFAAFAQRPLIRAVNYYPVAVPPTAWTLLASDGSAAAYAAALRSGPYSTGLTVMPPDLQPIVPLQSTSAWGDPFPDLSAALATANAHLAADVVTLQADAATQAALTAQLATASADRDAALASATLAVADRDAARAAATQAAADLTTAQAASATLKDRLNSLVGLVQARKAAQAAEDAAV